MSARSRRGSARSHCAITSGIDIGKPGIGALAWVMHDKSRGVAPEGVPSNMLLDRLQTVVQSGVALGFLRRLRAPAASAAGRVAGCRLGPVAPLPPISEPSAA